MAADMATTAAELLEQLKPAFPGKALGGDDDGTPFDIRGLRLTLVDVAAHWTTGDVGEVDKQVHHSSAQTVATYESPSHRFPRFMLQPSHGMLEAMMRMAGMKDIDFPSNPAFSSAYILTGTHPANVRRLFDHPPLLQALAQRRGITVASDLSRLSLYVWGKRFDAAGRKALAEAAASVFAHFEQAAAAAQARPAAKLDPKAYAASVPGDMGKALRKTLITRQELSAFFGQAVPRVFTPEMRAWLNRAASMWVVGMSALVLAVALLFVRMGLADDRSLGDKWLEIAFPALFAVVAVAVSAWTVRSRIRLTRLLRHGVLTVARIEALQATSGGNDPGDQYRMKVRFQSGASAVEAEFAVAGHAHERARLLKADGKPAPILHDPVKPQRILFVDGLLSLSPEIEP